MTGDAMHTQRSIKPLLLAAVGAALLLADFAPGDLSGWRPLREAQAIVGAPMTPMSYAGVARRTTARVVTAETMAVTTAAATTAAASQQQAAVAQQQAATAQKQAATAQQQAAVAQQQAAAARPAVGTVVPALPAGCAPEAIGGIEYQRCAGVYYRAAFQGNNLVYVVQQP
jgi:multidrug efflux pump subunit AcrA (membrane-fusion protein)